MLKTVGRVKNAQNAQKCFIESMIKRVLIELIIIIIIIEIMIWYRFIAA